MVPCRLLPEHPLELVGFTENEYDLGYSAHINTKGAYPGCDAISALRTDTFRAIAGLEHLDDMAPGSKGAMTRAVDAIASGRMTSSQAAGRYAFDFCEDYENTWDSLACRTALIMAALFERHGGLSLAAGQADVRYERDEEYMHIWSSSMSDTMILLPDGARMALISEYGLGHFWPGPEDGIRFSGKPVETYIENFHNINLELLDGRGNITDRIQLQGETDIIIAFEGTRKMLEDMDPRMKTLADEWRSRLQ